VRELDGEDDRLLEGCLGSVESCDVVPGNVGPFGEDGAGEAGTQLLGLGVDAVFVVFPTMMTKVRVVV
jgi:hypothetical protein